MPSFHFSHSQRAVVQNLVHGMLKHYHPRITLSMELTIVFSSFRTVDDFRKVNSVIVPDHYPLPVLSYLLQSIGKDNTVFTTLDLKSGFGKFH